MKVSNSKSQSPQRFIRRLLKMSYDADSDIDYRSDDDDDEPPPPPPDQDEEDEIAEKYNLILDSLLFPPHVKEHLMSIIHLYLIVIIYVE